MAEWLQGTSGGIIGLIVGVVGMLAIWFAVVHVVYRVKDAREEKAFWALHRVNMRILANRLSADLRAAGKDVSADQLLTELQTYGFPEKMVPGPMDKGDK